MTSKSRSGWIVCFAGAPITWASKIQTIMALSITEAEYIALSTSLREVIPLMGMLKEPQNKGYRSTTYPQRSTALSLTTTVELWNWLDCQKYVPEQNISTNLSITLGSMWNDRKFIFKPHLWMNNWPIF